jgi:acetate kinase
MCRIGSGTKAGSVTRLRQVRRASDPEILVVRTNEELMIARETEFVLGAA